MSAESDLRKLWSLAKILTPDGQEIATGAIRLPIPHAEGIFLPDRQTDTRNLDTLAGLKALAAIQTDRFVLLGWRGCNAPGTPGPTGRCYIGQHYHFVCEA